MREPLNKQHFEKSFLNIMEPISKIFISYHHFCKSEVCSLATDIKSLGYEVWFDDELSGGQNWWNRILKSIRECDIFVFAISKESLDSFTCKLEYKYAQELKNKFYQF